MAAIFKWLQKSFYLEGFDLINWKQYKSATARFLLISDILLLQNLLSSVHEVVPLFQLAEIAN